MKNSKILNEEQKQETGFEEWVETHLFPVLVIMVLLMDILIWVLIHSR